MGKYLTKLSYPILFCSGFTLSNELDLTSLDATVSFYYDQGIAESIRRTYQSSLRKLYIFSPQFLYQNQSYVIICHTKDHRTSLHKLLKHISWHTLYANLLRFAGTEGVFIAAMTTVGTEWHQESACGKTTMAVKMRLPITPAILHKIHGLWSAKWQDVDMKMFWAAATLCIFGFFRSGKITVLRGT